MKQAVAAFAENLNASWSEQRIRGELDTLARQIDKPQNELLDEVAMEIAQRFDRREMDHSIAMEKASALYNAVFLHQGVPPLLYEAYWALDEAEYGNESDSPSEEDAAENRSRAQVKRLLARSSRNDA
jgi:hypothetical protein